MDGWINKWVYGWQMKEQMDGVSGWANGGMNGEWTEWNERDGERMDGWAHG